MHINANYSLCTLFAGLRPELLNERLISLSNDTVAVVDMAEKSKGISPNIECEAPMLV